MDDSTSPPLPPVPPRQYDQAGSPHVDLGSGAARIPRVFISATSEDLEEQRGLARDISRSCNCEVSEMADWPADGHPPEEFIRAQMRGCDVLVLIVAGLYGTLHPTGVSYTEFEYQTAKSLGAHVIVLIRDSRFWDRRETDPERQKELERFQRLLRNENTHKEWRQMPDLSTQLHRSLLSATKPAAIATDNWELIAEVRRHINERRRLGLPAKSAQVIQFSGENAKGVVATLLNAGVNVDVFLGDIRRARQLENQHQEDLIRKNRYVKFRNTVLPNGSKRYCGEFKLYRYNAPASIRAVTIDNTFVALGTYVYMKKDVDGKPERVLDIRGGEKPMFIVQSGHPGFTVVLDMVRDLIENWIEFEIATPCNNASDLADC